MPELPSIVQKLLEHGYQARSGNSVKLMVATKPGCEHRPAIKQALVPAGMIPMVAVKREKMARDFIRNQLEMQAATYGKRIRLCRFVFAEVVEETKGGA